MFQILESKLIFNKKYIINTTWAAIHKSYHRGLLCWSSKVTASQRNVQCSENRCCSIYWHFTCLWTAFKTIWVCPTL